MVLINSDNWFIHFYIATCKGATRDFQIRVLGLRRWTRGGCMFVRVKLPPMGTAVQPPSSTACRSRPIFKLEMRRPKEEPSMT